MPHRWSSALSVKDTELLELRLEVAVLRRSKSRAAARPGRPSVLAALIRLLNWAPGRGFEDPPDRAAGC